MRKIGWRRIVADKTKREKIYCHSCGGKGEFRVTFRDSIGSLIITLCEDCLLKDYEELNLQSRLKFPLTDK